MRELSLHILDIAENGITAGADRIDIVVNEARTQDLLTIEITDNGRGLPAAKLENPADPFITSRTNRRTGLGLSLLAAAAERCEGRLMVETEPDNGTRVEAAFRYSHIDRAPVGNMTATIAMLIVGNPQVDFRYTHRIDDRNFSVNTRELKAATGSYSLADPGVIRHLTASIRDSIGRLISEEDRQD